METDKSVIVKGNALIDSANLRSNNGDMNEQNTPMISDNSQHQGENRGDIPKQENEDLVSCTASNVIPQPELAPENNPPPEDHEMSSADLSVDSDYLPDHEPDTATLDNSTVTDVPIMIAGELNNIYDRGYNCIVIDEPKPLGQQDVCDEMMMAMNYAEEQNNNNLPNNHHYGSLMCPALSEAVQAQNYNYSGSTQGNYGEELRSMAGNNWSDATLLDSNPMTSFATVVDSSPSLFTSAGSASTVYDGQAIAAASEQDHLHRPYDQSSVILESIQSSSQYQNFYNNLQNHVQIHPPAERLPMPRIVANSQLLLDMLNPNRVSDQRILTQSTIVSTTGLNLSTLSFTKLLSACDLMTSAFSEYWIKSQLTDDYDAQLRNNTVPNNNGVHYPNGTYGRSASLASGQTISASSLAPHPAREPVLMSNQAALVAIRARENNNNPQQSEIAQRNATRTVPRRRRTTLRRPNIYSRPPIQFPIRRSVASATSNNINGYNSSDAQMPNQPIVIQTGENISQSNGVPNRGRVNLGGNTEEVLPVRFRSSNAHRQEAAMESSASSSKRFRKEVRVKRELKASSSVVNKSKQALSNIGVTKSEENSNNINDYFIGSTSRSEDSRLRNIPNGLYDPGFESIGLPSDPFLRMFALSKLKDRK